MLIYVSNRDSLVLLGQEASLGLLEQRYIASQLLISKESSENVINQGKGETSHNKTQPNVCVHVGRVLLELLVQWVLQGHWYVTYTV